MSVNVKEPSTVDDEMKMSEALSQKDESKVFYLYCLENFSTLCRFCCQVKRSESEAIFNDSSDETLNESNELIEKIQYTLYDNILEKLDIKLSNLICKNCSQQIEEFYNFKKQCDRNADVLMEVKKELDNMANDLNIFGAAREDASDNFKDEEMENENEEVTQESEQSSNEEDTERIRDNSEQLDPTDPTEVDVKKEVKSRKRGKKSYKGKNSQCPICGKLVAGIQMHMLIHTGERRHKCSYCSKSFTQSGQLKRHINSHLNIRNYKCPEPGCGRQFVDPSSVTKHLVVHNKEDRKFQCSLCGSRFNRLGALRYHEKTHRQERSHECDICKKSFLAKYDLTKHYRTHTGEKPYSCKYCDKKFSISKNAKVHLRVHTKEKPYSCSFCDLSFAYRSSMKNHLIKIHNHADFSSLSLIRNNLDVENNVSTYD